LLFELYSILSGNIYTCPKGWIGQQIKNPTTSNKIQHIISVVGVRNLMPVHWSSLGWCLGSEKNGGAQLKIFGLLQISWTVAEVVLF
jgi:hypothetical protein